MSFPSHGPSYRNFLTFLYFSLQVDPSYYSVLDRLGLCTIFLSSYLY